METVGPLAPDTRAVWSVWAVAAAHAAGVPDLRAVRQACEEGDPATAEGWPGRAARYLGLTTGETDPAPFEALAVYDLRRPVP